MDTKTLVKQYEDEMIKVRRTIHQNPELSNKEFETTKLVTDKLTQWGIEIADIGMETGAVAIIRGKKPGKTIAIREDMDALPMPENTGLEFASCKENICHSCGHDIHTTTLLYTAKTLNDIKDELSGNVMLLFQPAEEGGYGAVQMKDKKFYEVLKPDRYIGLHVSPDLQVGTIGVKYGASHAAASHFKITITGKGGHGAHPEAVISPITIAAYLITQMETLIAREIYPLSSAVLTVGSIHGGSKGNIVPDQVEILGTMRNLDMKTRDYMKERLKCLVEGCCENMRGKGELSWFNNGVPVLYNDEEVAQSIYDAAVKLYGKENAIVIDKPSMGSEDFSIFTEFGPICQFGLGTANPNDPNSSIGIHNAKNIFDEGCLQIGTCVMVQTARDFLK